MTTYAIAHNLNGFSSSSLRVKVTRTDGENVWVVTADLLDAGTAMVLDASQIEYMTPVWFVTASNGLVSFQD